MPGAPRRPLKDELSVLAAQVAGVTAWRASVGSPFTAEQLVAMPREARMDAARRNEALAEEFAALDAVLLEQQQVAIHVISNTSPLRAVVAHRQDWMRQRLVQSLRDLRVRVPFFTDDGAHACAALVAEQPDLLICEPQLPLRNAFDVLQRAADCAPHTAIVVYGPSKSSETGATLLDAGASLVLSRQFATPPDVAKQAVALLEG